MSSNSETGGKSTLTLREPGAETLAVRKKGRGWAIDEKRLDKLHERAREMRRNPTQAQDALARALKEVNTGGFAFRRQDVIGSAIVDFACKPLMLVVQLEGDEDAPFAAARSRSLEEVGYSLFTLPAAEVLADPQAAAARVVEAMRERWQERRDRAKSTRSGPRRSRES